MAASAVVAVGAPEMLITIVAFVVPAFLLGSIPFGLLISKLFYRTDIRNTGSGNIGAMNALRAIGKRGAIAVLVLDAAKGVIPVAVFLAISLPSSVQTRTAAGDANLYAQFVLGIASLIAAAAVLGHCLSPWLKFKGGKGVATSFGALFVLCWPAGVAAIAGWCVGALVTTYSSVGSIVAHVVAAFALWYFTRNPIVIAYGVFVTLLIVYTHRENLLRLREGREQGLPFLRRNPRGS